MLNVRCLSFGSKTEKALQNQRTDIKRFSDKADDANWCLGNGQVYGKRNR